MIFHPGTKSCVTTAIRPRPNTGCVFTICQRPGSQLIDMGETRNSFGFAPPRKSRNCVTCGQSYKPGSAHSKYCLVCRKKKEHERREKAKVKSRDLNRVRYQLDKGYRTERLAQAAKNREETKLKVISHYSRQSFQCMCCGEAERDFLTIDHNDGNANRESRSQA